MKSRVIHTVHVERQEARTVSRLSLKTVGCDQEGGVDQVKGDRASVQVEASNGPEAEETYQQGGSRDEVTRVKIKKSCFEKRARWFPDLGLKTSGGDSRCT